MPKTFSVFVLEQKTCVVYLGGSAHTLAGKGEQSATHDTSIVYSSGARLPAQSSMLREGWRGEGRVGEAPWGLRTRSARTVHTGKNCLGVTEPQQNANSLTMSSIQEYFR